MELLSEMSNCAYFHHAHSLNEQLENIRDRMRIHEPSIDRISFALFDEEEQVLKTYADSCGHYTDLAHFSAPLSELPMLRTCVEERKSRIVGNLHLLSSSQHVTSLLSVGYRSSIAIPCFEQDKFVGFLFLNSRQENAFDESLIEKVKPYIDMVKFSIVSEYQIVHAIAGCAERTQALFPVYHKDSCAHKERISHYTRIIATEMANDWLLDDETIEHLSLFSRFHDLGKVRLSIDLICKSETLDTSERSTMRNHVENGIEIMDRILESLGNPNHPSITLLTQIMAYHHEFLDGSGYPFGLKGEDIPPAARIVSVANIFDALTTHRPYRQAWSITHALLELEKMVIAGKVDRGCVNALREHQEQLKAIIAQFPEHDPKDGFY
ncbi:HD domain-containing protein [Vibrio sp. IRLE0018]|uniref:HD domain-containing phosphohydrolase n=1 Tax=Vibrio TaxID=662 RepID=UPI001594866A|nr:MULTISPECIES: HD domain-containing phosphohydrolase [Vibrio]MCF8778273.1 HD domain-containing protein [Vibrio floridensis]NVC62488.1 HD domain-containing protein [Vibrio sp. 05-20-BW147]HAS6348535.1 HD domain-containing protein [Vibrio vulnificus]